MTREERLKQCRYYKGEERCPYDCLGLYWLAERLYVEHGDEHGTSDIFGDFDMYYERYHERTYRGIPYGILSRLYMYEAEKGQTSADSLTKFHEWMDYYIQHADSLEEYRKIHSKYKEYLREKEQN